MKETGKGTRADARNLETFEFPCATCGKPALVLQFWPKGIEHPAQDSKDPATIHVGLTARGLFPSGEAGTILINSIGISTSACPSAERYATLLEFARKGDVIALTIPELGDMESYCPKCKLHYCKDHMILLPLWDEDWFEGWSGMCPKGHEKFVNAV